MSVRAGVGRMTRRMARRLLILLLWLVAAFIALIIATVGVLRYVDPPTSAVMLADRFGSELIGIQHEWIDLEQISPYLPLAVMASEDQRFLTHWGFDLEAIVNAAREYQSGDGLRGASTISQQTAKNLLLWNGRHALRKLLEIPVTLAIEMLWPKRRIMEVYLNVAEFGRVGSQAVYGAEAASQQFFGMSASRIGSLQAARLAAVLPSPRRFSASNPTPYLQERADWIQRQMKQLGGPALIKDMSRAE